MHSADVKTKLALQAIKNEETIAQLASRFGVDPTWCQIGSESSSKFPLICLTKDINPASRQRISMAESMHHLLSISRQCELLAINRSSYYYKLKPVKPEDLELMRKIDELYTEKPMQGSRSIARQLLRQGIKATVRGSTLDVTYGYRGCLLEAKDQAAPIPNTKSTPNC